MSFWSLGQEYANSYVHQLSAENGLPHNKVTVVEKDSDDFIWIGTEDGLARFDSHNLKVYKHVPTDSFSISENQIMSVFEDSKSRIWVGTAHGGLNRINRLNSRFESVPITDNSHNTELYTALDILEDRYGNLWVGTHDGLFVLPDTSDSFKRIEVTIGRQMHITHLATFDHQRIWLGTENGLFMYDVINEELISYSFDPADPTTLSNNQIRLLFFDGEGHLWIGTMNGLNLFQGRHRGFKRYDLRSGLGSEIVLSACIMPDGSLWFGTDGAGIRRYNTTKDQFEKVVSRNSILDNIAVLDFLVDSNNLWIATVNKGVFALKVSEEKFIHYEYFHSEITRLGKNTVLDFAEDPDGRVWIGTDGGGLYRFDPVEHSVEAFTRRTTKGRISSDVVKSLLVDTQGQVYIGTYAGGLNVYSPREDKFRVFRHQVDDSSSISNDNVWSLFEDSRGRIWVGTLFDMNLFDPNAGNFKRYPSNRDDSTSLTSSVVFSIYEDRRGNIWFTTPDGLNRYDEDHDQFIRYHPNQTDPSKNYLKDIAEDEDGNLWITSKRLVYRFDGYSFHQSKFVDNIKAAPNSILLDNKRKDFWIGTNDGLYRINPESGVTRKFDEGDGLQGKEFRSGASLVAATGQFYMGGHNGFNVFDPGTINDRGQMPKIVLTRLMVEHEEIMPSDSMGIMDKEINYVEEIVLSHNQEHFSIDYNVVDYDFPSASTYAYKLEGFDKDWIFVGRDLRATYTNISPGQYTFLVKATNKDGLWSEHQRSLRIIITPAYWQTPSFWLLLVCLVVVLLYVLYRLRLSSILKNKRYLEEAVENRTTALRREIQARTRTEEQLQKTVETLKSTQEQLIISEKMASIGTLTAGIAHELNNPLNYIVGGTGMLKDLEGTITDNPETKKALATASSMIEDGANRSSKIIRSLMLYSHNGKAGKPEKMVTNIAEIIESVISYHKKELDGVELDLDLDLSLEWPVIPDRFGQAFLNIFGNALDATIASAHPLIRIGMEHNEEQCLISVFNSGSVIKEDLKNKIFEPFYTTKDPGKGTGLGLWITYNILEEHGGSIHFENQSDGVKFYLSIPVHDVT